MLNIGERITQLRKQHNLSQQELATKIGASRTIIGNYERNANAPSIDMLVKLAKGFNVSVDFLIGEGELSSYDKELLKRIEEIQGLPTNERERVLSVIDALLRDCKARQAYGQ